MADTEDPETEALFHDIRFAYAGAVCLGIAGLITAPLVLADVQNDLMIHELPEVKDVITAEYMRALQYSSASVLWLTILVNVFVVLKVQTGRTQYKKWCWLIIAGAAASLLIGILVMSISFIVLCLLGIFCDVVYVVRSKEHPEEGPEHGQDITSHDESASMYGHDLASVSHDEDLSPNLPKHQIYV